ncbi:MAG: ATP-dependent Clp protease ATP-binding subunit ClpX [candidate division Zixibacteria bacterium]|nr:ATP-dependent Clp protease ATP-binding subunit ClpX [candidate division Zixibacteria bacterium]MDD5425488.1 ATP-dependent Clp protease ATP-binding subunit ClpX [candidate division Zixibacteria bacterium]
MPKDSYEPPPLPQRCSFCGKPYGQVKRLFSGHDSFICNECVLLCSDLLHNAPDHEKLDEIHDVPRPAEIKNYLDQYVIGQETAKRTVSVAVYNHYKRINYRFKSRTRGKLNGDIDDVDLEKSNILLLGPTGTGKTLIARTLARFLKVPFTIADATVLTEAGYVGEDVENILVRLFQASNYNPHKTERGIIYIDEIDKISRKDGNPSITRDVSGEGVQQGLLKILEGTVSNIPPKGGRKHPEQAFVQIDTTNILFICGGAFDGLEKIIARRLGSKVVGFEAKKTHIDEKAAEIYDHIIPADLIEYGLIPELVGRVPVTAALQPLSKEAMLKILTDPKNALTKQYAKLMEMEGVKLTFEPEALTKAVEIAYEKKTGARALRSIFERAMLNVMFDIPSQPEVAEVIVTAETIAEGKEPRLVTHAEKKKAG